MLFNLAQMFGGLTRLTFLLDDSNGNRGAATFDAAVKASGKRHLTVIKATSGYVFGAFCPANVESPGWKPATAASFLFTFGADGSSPVKLSYKPGSGNGFHQTCGLHMGQGGDLVAWCSHVCAAPQQYTIVDPAFTSVNPTASTLAGGPSYTPSRMEVYAVGE